MLLAAGSSGCFDWGRFRAAPEVDGGRVDADAGSDGDALTVHVAPRCVAPGAPVVLRWSSAEEPCQPVGVPGESALAGCEAAVPSGAGPVGVQCGERLETVRVFIDVDHDDPTHRSIPYVGGAVDARLDDWLIPLFRVEGTRSDLPIAETDLRARVGLGWNERGLRVVAIVEDDSIELAPEIWQGLYRNDGIEVLLDGGEPAGPCDPGCRLSSARGEWQIFVQADGEIGSSERPLSAADGIEVAAERQPASYALELLVPWALMTIDGAGPGTQLGINIAINDRDDGLRDEDLPPALLWRYDDGHPNDAAQFPRVMLRCGTQPVATCE